jgi:hypothetical protein
MQLKIIDGEDWIGIYIDNKLVYEGHNIPLLSLLDLLRQNGLDIDYEIYGCDQKWLEERGNLPEKFEDVK